VYLTLLSTGIKAIAMGVFEVGATHFDDLDGFNSELAEIDTDELENDLYIIVGFSHLSEREFEDLLKIRGYSFTDLGAVKKIHRTYRLGGDDGDGEDEDDEEKRVAEYYLHYDETTGLILFYTDIRKTKEIDETVGELLSKQPSVHYLHVGPQLFRTIRETIRNEPHAEITRFIADRSEASDHPARIRGNYKRTIQYHGDDGLETLAEMETNYGVKPRNITFNITNTAKFRVIRDGVFALSDGDASRFFEYVELCITEALEVKEAFDSSTFEMLSTTESLSVPTSEPVAIQLATPLEYSEIEGIKSKMAEEDYLLVDSFKQEGSVLFSTKVFDTRKDNTFRIRASNDVIRVFPQESDENVGSFLRFHEFVEENIDPNTSVTAEG